MINKNLFTSNSQHWATPSNLYSVLQELNYYDPCTINGTYTDLEIACKMPLVYINPPFNALDKWVNWILLSLDQAIKDKKYQCFVLCMPSRTDTIYFDRLMYSKHVERIVFIRGRLHFNDSKRVAPFPTMFLFIDNSKYKHTWCETMPLDMFIHKLCTGFCT